MKPQIKGALFVLLGMLLFSVMSAVVKLVSGEVSAVGSVFYRGLVGTILIYGYARYKKVNLRGKRRGLLAARAIMGTIALVMVFYAFTKIPTANAMLLNQTTPVFMIPLAVFFLGETTSWKHILLVLVALLGVGLVLKPDISHFNIPGALALGSAFFAAVAYLLVRKLTGTEDPLTIVFWFAAISMVAVFPVFLNTFQWPSPMGIAQVLLIGVLGTVGQVFLTVGYKLGEAGRLAVVGGTAALFCALWDFVLFGHLPDLLTALGGAMVIFSCSAIQILRHGKR